MSGEYYLLERIAKALERLVELAETKEQRAEVTYQVEYGSG